MNLCFTVYTGYTETSLDLFDTFGKMEPIPTRKLTSLKAYKKKDLRSSFSAQLHVFGKFFFLK